MAPRDAQTPPLEESFAALARQTLNAAHDHVPQCVLPPDDRKARMCPRPRPPLPLLLLRRSCPALLLLLLLLLRAAAEIREAAPRLRLVGAFPTRMHTTVAFTP